MADTNKNRVRLSAFALLCALAPVSFADEPAWLTEARAREAKLIDATSFRSTDGVLTGRTVSVIAARSVRR